DASRREQIERARAGVWRDVLNPILERKEQRTQAAAKALGYRSYVALSEEARMVSIRDLLAEGHRFFQATDALYRPLRAEGARKSSTSPTQPPPAGSCSTWCPTRSPRPGRRCSPSPRETSRGCGTTGTSCAATTRSTGRRTR